MPATRRVRPIPDRGARLWIANTARKNFWRVAAWYELSDLIQDGYMCYYLVRKKYPQAIDREHIMSLLRSTFVNHITDLANKTTRLAEVPDSPQVGDQSEQFSTIDNFVCEFSELTEMIADAPVVVGEAIKALIANPAAFQEAPIRLDRTRETNNARICRLLGLDPKNFDLPKMIYDYLKGGVNLPSMLSSEIPWASEDQS
jgi:hypothetical protein